MAAKVLLLNDDSTTMEFVVQVLQDVFGKPREEALRLVLDVHKNGSGVCGTYTPEQAWNVAQRVTELARQNNCPLRCMVEPDPAV